MATIDKSLPTTLMEEELLNQNPVDQMLPEEPTSPSDVEVLNTPKDWTIAYDSQILLDTKVLSRDNKEFHN